MRSSQRWRLLVLGAVVLIAIGGSIAYVVTRRTATTAAVAAVPAGAPPIRVTALTSVEALPRIVFRSTDLGDGYGKVAMVALADPGGPRAYTSTSCDRLYATAAGAICLVLEQVPVQVAHVELLSGAFEQLQDLPLIGLPTRARLSADGMLSASTSFRSGDSYTTPGQFSTQTLIRSSAGASTDLEDVPLFQDGRRIDAADRNFWGVTFAADDDTFYATAAWGGQTWLVRGSVSAQRMDTVQQDAECPSLSPDGTTVVYKKLGGRSPGSWRLTALTLATGTEVQLAESRSVDDQVEWLDDRTVLYGVPRSGVSETSVTDIFAVPVDGTGAPALLIPAAASPSVIRG